MQVGMIGLTGTWAACCRRTHATYWCTGLVRLLLIGMSDPEKRVNDVHGGSAWLLISSTFCVFVRKQNHLDVCLIQIERRCC